MNSQSIAELIMNGITGPAGYDTALAVSTSSRTFAGKPYAAHASTSFAASPLCYHMDMSDQLYTIGYASFSIGEFVETLRKYDITLIADVRSAPYSRYKPDFSRDTLQKHLAENDIVYLFLGNLLGARIKNSDVYQDGKLSYSLLAGSDFWKIGINRILDEGKNRNLAIMCAEKDPVKCHRTFLVCRTLRSFSVKIQHILEDGSLEEHSTAERRLLHAAGFKQPDIFLSERDCIDDAYERLCEAISIPEPGWS